jgi:4-amino-4-deoxy-L-arabinose transferase-like glycosyltransferase
VALAVVAGAAFRLVHYGLNPSLTLDDAMLSFNIASRSWAGLTHPLAFQQTAPLGFLWASRAATLLGGLNEFALRVVPVLAGVAIPYGVWLLARRLLSPRAAAVAAFFAALSPILIQYSISVKPYETDALFATGVALATLTTLARPVRRSWVTLGAVGVAALLFSTPAVFVLAGCGLALALTLRRRAILPLTLIGSVWIALFAVLYWTVTRAEAVSPYMQWFWDHKFLTPAVMLAEPGRAWDIVQRLPTQVFTGDAPQLVALILCWFAAVAGVWQVSRTQGARVWVLVGPIAFALVASMFRRYPVAPRLFLFAAPFVAVILAAGVERGRMRLAAGASAPRLVLEVLVVLWFITIGVLSANTSRLWAPPTRPLIQELRRERVDHEPLYVFSGAVPAWLFYTTHWEDPSDTSFAMTVAAAERWDGNAFQNAASRGHAVADTEGGRLIGVQDGFPVVIGLSTGIAWREGQWLSQLQPDSGWAEREAERIDTVTDSSCWLLFSQLVRREVPLLTHALAARHGQVILERGSRGALLYRVRFTRGGRGRAVSSRSDYRRLPDAVAEMKHPDR